MIEKQNFYKNERLKSTKTIGKLFSEGKSFGMYPLRLVWLESEQAENTFPVQFTVSVPKKKFKRAVDRNRIKRQVREAWRLNKNQLYRQIEFQNKRYAFMIIYTAKDPFPYKEIEKSMQRMIRKFVKVLE